VRQPLRRSPLLLVFVALLAPACGGSGGSTSSSSGSTSSVGTSPSSSANPCTAALASAGTVTARAALTPWKASGFRYDVRDPRDLLALHQLPRERFVSARAGQTVASRSGDIAILQDNGSLVVAPNPFDLGGVGLRFDANGQGN
jgi:hypothetical protein